MIKGSLPYLKFITVFIIVTILLWMIVFGGCIDSVRIRLHNDTMKVYIIFLFVSFGSVVGRVFFTECIFESMIKLLIEKRRELISTQLLF